MELEFDVKITGNILYDYMLRHTYYSASGLIGTIVGALMVVLFFFRGRDNFPDCRIGDSGISALDAFSKIKAADGEYAGI